MSPKRDEFKFESANESILGKDWFPIYSTHKDVKFGKNHFEIAMMNVIKEPNINSSAILRADIPVSYTHLTLPTICSV